VLTMSEAGQNLIKEMNLFNNNADPGEHPYSAVYAEASQNEIVLTIILLSVSQVEAGECDVITALWGAFKAGLHIGMEMEKSR
jgi:hypothetical protein